MEKRIGSVKVTVITNAFFAATERQRDRAVKEGCVAFGVSLFGLKVPKSGKWVNLPFEAVFTALSTGKPVACRRFRYAGETPGGKGVPAFSRIEMMNPVFE